MPLYHLSGVLAEEYQRNKFYTSSADDDMPLPAFLVSKVNSLISDGAGDLTQNWANALHLVKKAYKVANQMGEEDSSYGEKYRAWCAVNGGKLAIPAPTKRTQWTQFEEFLARAVKELAKQRGLDGDWRLSSSKFLDMLKDGVQTSCCVTVGDADVAIIRESGSFDWIATNIIYGSGDGVDVCDVVVNSERCITAQMQLPDGNRVPVRIEQI